MWLSSINKEPSTPLKFVFGLLFVALGFILMVVASGINAKYGKISALWLISVYLFHTIGELCLSPVGLSMVTKLSPVKFVSLLMGVWFLASFFAGYVGGVFAGNYDTMNHSLFFMYPVALAGGSAILLLLIVNPLKKWMGGVE